MKRLNLWIFLTSSPEPPPVLEISSASSVMSSSFRFFPALVPLVVAGSLADEVLVFLLTSLILTGGRMGASVAGAPLAPTGRLLELLLLLAGTSWECFFILRIILFLATGLAPGGEGPPFPAGRLPRLPPLLAGTGRPSEVAGGSGFFASAL